MRWGGGRGGIIDFARMVFDMLLLVNGVAYGCIILVGVSLKLV